MKKNLMLLGVLILLIVAFMALSRTEKNAERGHLSNEIVAVDSAAVSKIEIKRPEDAETVVLEKRGNDWFVTAPIDYKANQSFVANILDKTSKLKIVAQVTNNPESYGQFKADSSGTSVKIYEGAAQKADWIVGQSRNSVTFFRAAKAKDVVSVDGYLPSLFNRKPVDWRDKTIASFEKEQLQSIKLTVGAETLTLNKRPGGGEEWDLLRAGDGETYYGKIDRINQIVNALWKFNTIDFKDKPDETMLAKFAAPDSTVLISLSTGAQITLHFAPEDETGNRYLVKRTDTGDKVYFIATKMVIDNILAKLDDLKGEPPAPAMPDSTKAAVSAAAK